jgi:DtxR family Mn-dependent transcriptional regulator
VNSESIEDYLKTIYLIQEEQNGSPVSTTSLSTRLGVTNASVTGMLKHLSGLQPRLVNYERYYGVTLSPDGFKSAVEIIRHHRLIESFLYQKLGYTWDKVHSEAERLEHFISEEMEERMAIALGHPDIDPHGDPIPDMDGNIFLTEYPSLASIPIGKWVEIRRVRGQEPELLQYLSSLGLVLTAKIQIISIAPLNGPIGIRLAQSVNDILTISQDMAEKILVEPSSHPVGVVS